MDYKLFRLTIKGSLAQCLIEIEKRGLTPLGWHEYDDYISCSIDVESCHEYLGGWFRENSECVEGVGFPSGTLLLYTSHEAYNKPINKLSGIL